MYGASLESPDLDLVPVGIGLIHDRGHDAGQDPLTLLAVGGLDDRGAIAAYGHPAIGGECARRLFRVRRVRGLLEDPRGAGESPGHPIKRPESKTIRRVCGCRLRALRDLDLNKCPSAAGASQARS